MKFSFVLKMGIITAIIKGISDVKIAKKEAKLAENDAKLAEESQKLLENRLKFLKNRQKNQQILEKIEFLEEETEQDEQENDDSEQPDALLSNLFSTILQKITQQAPTNTQGEQQASIFEKLKKSTDFEGEVLPMARIYFPSAKDAEIKQIWEKMRQE
jgi:hypothetical protein